MAWGWGWRPYVSAAEKRAKGLRHARALEKRGRKLEPVKINGRAIATTFWGKAWCENLERYSDFANRLPRGRTYARNGSILDLQIASGQVTAIVCGSDIYNVRIKIETLAGRRWKQVLKDCSQSIGSLFDLLQGKLSDSVMERLTQPREGLFPEPKEIRISCSCPDWAGLCKHAAAVMYGVGARLDTQPDLLFRLRNVDHEELIQQAAEGPSLYDALKGDGNGALTDVNLGELFGIELDASSDEKTISRKTRRRGKAATSRKSPSNKRAASPKKRSTVIKSEADRRRTGSKQIQGRPSAETKEMSAKVKRSKTTRARVAEGGQSKSKNATTQIVATGMKKTTKRARKTGTAGKTTAAAKRRR